MITLTGYWG